MLVNKNKLKEALAIVKPGLAQKEDIAQATSFAFIDGHVVTYNDRISIRHPVDGIVEIQGAIAAEQLYKFLDKITKDEVEIEHTDSEIRIQCGRIKAGFVLQSEIILPLEELDETKEWKPIPAEFSVAVDFVARACSRELDRPILNCIHVSPEGYAEASDGHRIARHKIPEYEFGGDILLPMQDILQVASLTPVFVSWGRSWVHFKTAEETIISCRKFDGSFPRIDPHLEMKGKRISFPQLTLEVLGRAQVFAKRDTAMGESVTVQLGNNRFKMESHSDTGWFEEELNFKYNEEPISFSVTPTLLKDILSDTLECELGTDRLKFTSDKWVYMTLLRV